MNQTYVTEYFPLSVRGRGKIGEARYRLESCVCVEEVEHCRQRVSDLLPILEFGPLGVWRPKTGAEAPVFLDGPPHLWRPDAERPDPTHDRTGVRLRLRGFRIEG